MNTLDESKAPDAAIGLALGSSALRLVVLRLVVLQGSVTVSDLVAAIGLSPNGARKHLRALEDAGVLRSGLERSGSTRSTQTWSIELERVREIVDELDVYLAGQ